MKTSLGVSALLLLTCSVVSSAQGNATKKVAGGPVKAAATTQKPIPLKPATVSGYVFAVTKGGDLKPARLAHISMFYSHASGDSVGKLVGPTFAADIFAKEVTNGLEEARVWLASRPYLQESTKCNNIMFKEYQSAVEKTIQWGQDMHPSQLLFGDADEEGKFEITIPPSHLFFEVGIPHDHVYAPGVYLVVAWGTAGYNNAFWESEITIEPGETVKLKMSVPTMACPKLDSE